MGAEGVDVALAGVEEGVGETGGWWGEGVSLAGGGVV